MESKEIMDTVNETINEAVETSQAKKGEVTTLVLMNLNTIYNLAREGHTQQEICERLGINPRTFRKIKAKNKVVQAVFAQAEKDMTEKVKQSLYYQTQPRVVKKQKVLSNGKIVEYEEIIQPEPSLIKYWLNNKSDGEFSDRQELNVRKVEYVIEIVDDAEEAKPVVDTDYIVEEDTTNIEGGKNHE